eukprot:scaffold26171_cov201-Cylindrotheca_fusiformis.AAC.1
MFYQTASFDQEDVCSWGELWRMQFEFICPAAPTTAPVPATTVPGDSAAPTIATPVPTTTIPGDSATPTIATVPTAVPGGSAAPTIATVPNTSTVPPGDSAAFVASASISIIVAIVAAFAVC